MGGLKIGGPASPGPSPGSATGWIEQKSKVNEGFSITVSGIVSIVPIFVLKTPGSRDDLEYYMRVSP